MPTLPAVCGTSGWERTNVGEPDPIFDIATPIGALLAFVRSYAKSDGAGRTIQARHALSPGPQSFPVGP
jgi:hypothetical protein